MGWSPNISRIQPLSTLGGASIQATICGSSSGRGTAEPEQPAASECAEPASSGLGTGGLQELPQPAWGHTRACGGHGTSLLGRGRQWGRRGPESWAAPVTCRAGSWVPGPAHGARRARLTHSTEVGKAVLALLGVDQVAAALPGGRPLQHCFKQRAAVGRVSRAGGLPQPPWGSPPPGLGLSQALPEAEAMGARDDAGAQATGPEV